MLTSVRFSSGTAKKRSPAKVQAELEHRTCFDQGSEVMDLNNIVVRPEQLKKALEVQPLKGAAADGAVVKVEPVYVDDGARRH